MTRLRAWAAMSDSVGMRNYNGVYCCLGLLLFGLLSGCVSRPASPGEERLPNVNLSGFPADYRKAYGEGCTLARSGGTVAQAPAFSRDAPQAAQGWRDGFDYCKRAPR